MGPQRAKLGASDAYVDLANHVLPLFGAAQGRNELVKLRRVLRREFEPGEKVEGLARCAQSIGDDARRRLARRV